MCFHCRATFGGKSWKVWSKYHVMNEWIVIDLWDNHTGWQFFATKLWWFLTQANKFNYKCSRFTLFYCLFYITSKDVNKCWQPMFQSALVKMAVF